MCVCGRRVAVRRIRNGAFPPAPARPLTLEGCHQRSLLSLSSLPRCSTPYHPCPACLLPLLLPFPDAAPTPPHPLSTLSPSLPTPTPNLLPAPTPSATHHEQAVGEGGVEGLQVEAQLVEHWAQHRLCVWGGRAGVLWVVCGVVWCGWWW